VEWDWVHLVRRSLFGLLYQPPDDRWWWWWWWWWVWISRWNENYKGKPKYSEKTCPRATLFTTNPTWPDLGSKSDGRGGKSTTNRLSYGTVCCLPCQNCCTVCQNYVSRVKAIFPIYTCKPLNNVTSLAAWKNVQTNDAYWTTTIIILHRHPYELHKQHALTPTPQRDCTRINPKREILNQICFKRKYYDQNEEHTDVN
jgi:hypothetical protein